MAVDRCDLFAAVTRFGRVDNVERCHHILDSHGIALVGLLGKLPGVKIVEAEYHRRRACSVQNA